MEFTGERFIPGVHGNIELEHYHRYYLACEIAHGKDVLDIACGEGYGSAILAQKAAHVIGVDISDQVISHATDRYRRENLEFKVGSCTNIPIRDATVDLVVCFETIEYLDQHDQMMREIKRVLRPDGALLISSPDKSNYSVESGSNNPYHVKELFRDEFELLLAGYYKNLILFGQRIVYGSHIIAQESPTYSLLFAQEGDAYLASPGISRPLHWLALASDGHLPDLPSSIFEQPIADSEFAHTRMNLLDEREREISNLNDLLNERKNKVEDLEKEIVVYVTSNSWRWTRVFRQISKAIKKRTGRS